MLLWVKNNIAVAKSFWFGGEKKKRSFWFQWLSAQFMETSVFSYYTDISVTFLFFPDFHEIVFGRISVLRHIHLFLI